MEGLLFKRLRLLRGAVRGRLIHLIGRRVICVHFAVGFVVIWGNFSKSEEAKCDREGSVRSVCRYVGEDARGAVTGVFVFGKDEYDQVTGAAIENRRDFVSLAMNVGVGCGVVNDLVVFRDCNYATIARWECATFIFRKPRPRDHVACGRRNALCVAYHRRIANGYCNVRAPAAAR